LSTANWMFTSGDWILDVAQKVSPPTSIRYQTTANFWLYSLYTPIVNAPEGRIVTNFRTSHNSFGRANVFFRAQHMTGAPVYPKGYWIETQPTKTYLYRRTVTGVGYSEVGFWTLNTFNNIWYQIRVTFWQAYDLNNVPTLRTRFERFEGGAWVNYGNIDDAGNHFAAEPFNRMGVGARVIGPGRWVWQDDTELWLPC